MNNQEKIEKATLLAKKAHGNQRRKYGSKLYVSHSMNVAKKLKDYDQNYILVIAGLLHDVIEDTDYTADKLDLELQDFLVREDSRKVVSLVLELTNAYGKNKFPALNRDERKKLECARLSNISPEAQTVKYADIMDNLDINLIVEDRTFAKVYSTEKREIIMTMNKGDRVLYEACCVKVLVFFENLHPIADGEISEVVKFLLACSGNDTKLHLRHESYKRLQWVRL